MMDSPMFSSSTSSLLIGIMAVLHFILASMGGLAPLIVYIAEGSALKQDNPHIRKMAKGLLTISLELAAISGILGSGVVVLLVGLRPQVINLIVNIYFWFMVLQLTSFIGGIACQFGSYFTWDKPESHHRLWGLLAAILPLIPFVTFSAAAAFINNSGSWAETGSLWSAVFTPSYFPALLHRAAAGLALIGVLLTFYHTLRGTRKNEEDNAYRTTAASWGSKLAQHALEAQIVIGLVRTLVVPPAAQSMIMGGSLTFLWVLGIIFGLIALGYLAIQNRRKAALTSWAVLLLAVIPVLGAVWTMGVTRSRARGAESIQGVITREDEVINVPQEYQLSTGSDGEEVYNSSCAACHPGLAGDALALSQEFYPQPDNLAAYLRDPAAAGIAMPPFTGSDEDMQVLIDYLLQPTP